MTALAFKAVVLLFNPFVIYNGFKTKLAILRDENLDHFLNASLASLRLIQNILEYPKADRYRMIRSDAPVSYKT